MCKQLIYLSLKTDATYKLCVVANPESYLFEKMEKMKIKLNTLETIRLPNVLQIKTAFWLFKMKTFIILINSETLEIIKKVFSNKDQRKSHNKIQQYHLKYKTMKMYQKLY